MHSHNYPFAESSQSPRWLLNSVHLGSRVTGSCANWSTFIPDPPAAAFSMRPKYTLKQPPVTNALPISLLSCRSSNDCYPYCRNCRCLGFVPDLLERSESKLPLRGRSTPKRSFLLRLSCFSLVCGQRLFPRPDGLWGNGKTLRLSSLLVQTVGGGGGPSTSSVPSSIDGTIS